MSMCELYTTEPQNPGGDPVFLDIPETEREVIHFDKARMEINDPDADADDLHGPTYASLQHVLDAPAREVGTQLTEQIDRDGNVTTSESWGPYNVTVGHVDMVTEHSIATPFWDFMNSDGLVYGDGDLFHDALFENPFYATGRPVTEAYWANVKVGGEQRDVLIQCFERRCLTYTPGNDEGFVVEAGNVGQHYFHWRYVQAVD